ncbi:MAG: hypothetical protein V2A74_05885 [bacterium]
MTEHPKRWAWTALALSIALYLVAVLSHLSLAYIDFGDGNYLYISWRITQGARLYSDILAPQPPVHLMLGSALLQIGKLFGSPLFTVRVFCALLQCAMAVLVFAITWRLFRSWLAAACAAVVYLVLPVGFWWTLGYQSEHIEKLLLLSGVFLLLNSTRRSAIFAGLLLACACFTNMTAVPYAAFVTLYLAIARREILWAFLIPLVGAAFFVALTLEIWTGAYFNNVFFNQVGTFPRSELLGQGQTLFDYIIHKLSGEGADVLRLEGGFILLAFAGMVLAASSSERQAQGAAPASGRHPINFFTWYSLASLGSIIVVSKGGTEDYIFSLGEPYVAVFAGYSVAAILAHFGGVERAKDTANLLEQRLLNFFSLLGLFIVLAALIMLPSSGLGLVHNWASLTQRTYEDTDLGVRKVLLLIDRYSEPGAEILAPPYYAFLSGRKIAEDYSELFIWSIKYHHEQLDGIRGDGTRKAEALASAIREKKLPLLIVDMNQTWRIPPIRQAVEQDYRPVLEEPIQTLNTRLGVYVPRSSD